MTLVMPSKKELHNLVLSYLYKLHQHDNNEQQCKRHYGNSSCLIQLNNIIMQFCKYARIKFINMAIILMQDFSLPYLERNEKLS